MPVTIVTYVAHLVACVLVIFSDRVLQEARFTPGSLAIHGSRCLEGHLESNRLKAHTLVQLNNLVFLLALNLIVFEINSKFKLRIRNLLKSVG